MAIRTTPIFYALLLAAGILLFSPGFGWAQEGLISGSQDGAIEIASNGCAIFNNIGPMAMRRQSGARLPSLPTRWLPIIGKRTVARLFSVWMRKGM